MTIVSCAWCGKVIERIKDFNNVETHGVCSKCEKEYKEKLERERKRRKEEK